MLEKFKPFKLLLKSDLILPALLLFTYIGFLIIARGVVPTTDELINTFADLYSHFGYEIIFIAAFLEALVLINLFVPGQIAMALGVIFARTGHTELSWVLLAAISGQILGYLMDYLLGYFGFAEIIKKVGYRSLVEQAQKQISKLGARELILSFLHSNIGSFMSLAAGIVRYKLASFLILVIVSTIFWDILWATIIYTFGDIVLLFIRRYAFLLVIFIITGMFLINFYKGKNK